MDKNILQQLYDGKIYPAENIGDGNPELQKLNDRAAGEKAEFIKSLSETDRANFQIVTDLNDEAAAFYGYECFAYGFKLAVSLLLESLSGKEGLARNDDSKKDVSNSSS